MQALAWVVACSSARFNAGRDTVLAWTAAPVVQLGATAAQITPAAVPREPNSSNAKLPLRPRGVDPTVYLGAAVPTERYARVHPAASARSVLTRVRTTISAAVSGVVNCKPNWTWC